MGGTESTSDEDFDPNSDFLTVQTAVWSAYALVLAGVTIGSLCDELGLFRPFFRWFCGASMTAPGARAPNDKPAVMPYWMRRTMLLIVIPAEALVGIDLDGARGIVPVPAANIASVALQFGYCIGASVWIHFTARALYRQLATPMPDWIGPALVVSSGANAVITLVLTAMSVGDLHRFAVCAPIANAVMSVEGAVLIAVMWVIGMRLRADLKKFIATAQRYAANANANRTALGPAEGSRVVSVQPSLQPSALPAVSQTTSGRIVAAPAATAKAVSTGGAAPPASVSASSVRPAAGLSVNIALAVPTVAGGAPVTPKSGVGTARPSAGRYMAAPTSPSGAGGGGGGLSDTRHIETALSRLMFQIAVTTVVATIPVVLGLLGALAEGLSDDVYDAVWERYYRPSSRHLSLGTLTGWLFQLVGVVPTIIMTPPTWRFAAPCRGRAQASAKVHPNAGGAAAPASAVAGASAVLVAVASRKAAAAPDPVPSTANTAPL